jgi:hypothetical protein
LALTTVLLACAPTLPERYVVARAAAERAYASGRYAEAADRWLEAATATDRKRDAEEARFRAAASFARAGASERAQAEYARLAAKPEGDRAPRAEYERIRLERLGGNADAAHADLLAFLRRFPDSGLAPAALDECLRWYEEHSTERAALAWLDGEIAAIGRTELGEALEYRRARLLDSMGQTRRARDAYRALAKRYPYPRGAYWDDALWYASKADERLGDYSAALADLNRMLAEREPAYLQGSYTRSRYDDAQYRIAELYRDALGDPRAARRAFDRVFTEHETSTLRDDALWNEALLARPDDPTDACRVLARLARALPDSRYVPCIPLICPDVARPQATTAQKPATECRAYLQRELARPHR